MAQHQQHQEIQSNSGSTTLQPQYQYIYTPPPSQLSYYNKLFFIADKSCVGYLSGQRAVEFLSTSKLPIHVLQQIWTMAMMIISDEQQEQPQLQQQNKNKENNTFLDRNRFYVVMRLIQLFQNEKKPIDSSLNVGSEGQEGDDDTMRLPFFEGVTAQEVVMHAQVDEQGEGQMHGMTKIQHINNEGGIIS